MHHAALTYIAETVGVPRPWRVLEFGARNINGSARGLFPGAVRYLGVDIAGGSGVDLIADAATVAVGEQFDIVICAEVLEHANDDTCAGICANAHRHLVPGGMFIATMAGPGRAEHSAVDGGGLQPGEFYRNVDRTLLAGWLQAAGFDEFDIDQLGPDMRCTARR